MEFIPTTLEGCYIIEPKIIKDERGYFMESFNENTFQKGVHQDVHFVQDNQSFSTKGVLRGLHYQTGIHAQAKLVRVLQGEVLDVAVDIRPDSLTFGQHISVVLSGENQRQFFVPRGFAHGFLVLSETATFFYKCDNFYNKDSEGGIMYNDEQLNIDWQFPATELVISEKDHLLPTLENAKCAQ
ncbi:dTDP-4-dehydrorhamnose 3,5-epimerase [Flavobacterium fryxellicola]|uniref:dTDP-4-dehydrorhamnose 3,5-epimerase n=1 Tax=Flavobacterium fryxellicola TaxID=249352 RepID=A0A168AJB7_9FLAO|nr:dTDP-4-dehydrorhamnose 3,5-epimerase [Flavobacterium fryxellicola]OAB31533.1 dTDP-4-dehydrorhamnose 3,5-epimerase [Flavobacterium fryxellicola]SHN52970.1 dTDP-4-dehydrorhamnose 3,5-epimerase [Flavobacterium fryxellicola]